MYDSTGFLVLFDFGFVNHILDTFLMFLLCAFFICWLVFWLVFIDYSLSLSVNPSLDVV